MHDVVAVLDLTEEVKWLDSDTRAHVFTTIDVFIKAVGLKGIAALYKKKSPVRWNSGA